MQLLQVDDVLAAGTLINARIELEEDLILAPREVKNESTQTSGNASLFESLREPKVQEASGSQG